MERVSLKILSQQIEDIANGFRWMFILFPAPGTGVEFKTSHEEYLRRVKQLVGDNSIPAEVLGVSKWYINEIVAEYYSKDNMYSYKSFYL